LLLLENALEGSGGGGAPAAYMEAYRIIMRLGLIDKSFIVRLAAARCLRTFGSIGCIGIGMPELENSLGYCVKVILEYKIIKSHLYTVLQFRLIDSRETWLDLF
jgi:hypothetical protein